MDTLAHKELMAFLEQRLPRLQTPDDPNEWRLRAAAVRQRLMEFYFEGHPEGLLDGDFEIEWTETIEQFDGYRIRKLKYEGYPGLMVPALLYEPKELEGPAPAVLNPNGHHAGGKAMPYKQARCINLAKRGMLALNFEFIGQGELFAFDHSTFVSLDLCGIQSAGIFYLIMKRALDLLLDHPYADPERVAMTGLSGGGWQTIILSALDERITHSIPVAGYSAVWQRKDYPCDIGDQEQVPNDLCTIADYDTLTAMLAPRPSLLIYNREDDCCFQPGRTRLSIFQPAQPVFELLNAGDKLGFYVNHEPGTHNYDADNRSQLYKFLNEHMGLDHSEEDLHFEDELLSEEELAVGLPPDNATIASLSAKALTGIRREHASRPAFADTLEAARRKLADIIRLPEYTVNGRLDQTAENAGTVELKQGTLICEAWSIPATAAVPADVKAVTINLNGRPTEISQVPVDLEDTLIIYPEIFGKGEYCFDTCYLMLVAGAGERPLGIQTAQILGLVEWAAAEYGIDKISLEAGDRNLGLAIVIAAALQPERIESLTTGTLMTSLAGLIEKPLLPAPDTAAMYCFGLLKEFDMRELIRMSDPLEIHNDSRGLLRPQMKTT